MFEELSLGNFKCYRDLTLPLRRLTLFVGPNNAGKSSILQSILMLAQTLDSPTESALVTNGRFVNLGSMSDILSVSRTEHDQMRIGVKATQDADSPFAGNELSLHYNSTATNLPFLTSSSIQHNGKNIVTVDRVGNTDSFTLRANRPRVKPSPRISLISFLPNLLYSRTPTSKVTSSRNSGIDPLNSIGFRIFISWRARFGSIWHAKPIRQDIPPFAQIGITYDVPPESGGDSFLISLSTETRENVVNKINSWISKHDFMISTLAVEKLDKHGRLLSLMATERASRLPINVASMGRGISQSLPILARILNSRDGECGIIEQPELHLHPAAQAELGDAFCEMLSKK